MSSTLRRRAATSIAAVVLALVGLVATTPPASAAPVLPISWDVSATTHMKALNLDVAIKGGRFVGGIDLANGALSGNLTLPPATTRIKMLGLPLADVTFAMVPTGPVTGHVDLATMKVTTTATFNIRIVSMRPVLLPVNLVGSTCRTATPISVPMSGTANLTGPSTFSGTYAIPRFQGCGLAVTPILNLIAPGGGNTFSASFAPPAA